MCEILSNSDILVFFINFPLIFLIFFRIFLIFLEFFRNFLIFLIFLFANGDLHGVRVSVYAHVFVRVSICAHICSCSFVCVLIDFRRSAAAGEWISPTENVSPINWFHQATRNVQNTAGDFCRLECEWDGNTCILPEWDNNVSVVRERHHYGQCESDSYTGTVWVKWT